MTVLASVWGAVEPFFGIVTLIAGGIFAATAAKTTAAKRAVETRFVNLEAALHSAVSNVEQLTSGRERDREDHKHELATARTLAQSALDEARIARSEIVKSVSDAAIKAMVQATNEVMRQAAVSLAEGQSQLLTEIRKVGQRLERPASG